MSKTLIHINIGLVVGLLFTIVKIIYSKLTGQTRRINKKLGTQLIESGFLDFADISDRNELEFEIKNTFNVYDERNFKLAHIDSEELAEFSFDFFLPSLNKMLKKRNFNLKVSKAEDYEITNCIYINESKVELYTNLEIENGTFWDRGAINFFKRINEFMISEQLQEKFYLLYGGNDLFVFLLTDEQYRIIKHRYFDNENEQPYLP
ncbi:MAG: hypothetical protein ACE364_05865 [Chlorobiota bacterium]